MYQAIVKSIFIKEYSKPIILSFLIILLYLSCTSYRQALLLALSILESIYLQPLMNRFQCTYFNANIICFYLCLKIDQLQSKLYLRDSSDSNSCLCLYKKFVCLFLNLELLVRIQLIVGEAFVLPRCQHRLYCFNDFDFPIS